MIHDQIASVVALARTTMGGLDMSHEHTQVRTATLKLLLEVLIDLGAPEQNQKFADAAARTVMGSLAALNGAGNGRP